MRTPLTLPFALFLPSLLICYLAALWPCVAAAADVPDAPGAADATAVIGAALSPVVITATRLAQASFDLPVAIDRVERAAIQPGKLQVNLSESLDTVPGASVESRQNYAQDLQISIRGFGARSSFGVRGVRLYSDGIPGTMPDGQGQFSQFDLGSADHIEVMRGPFSALYGNSSGGVIAIFTEDGAPGNRIDGSVDFGSLGTQRYALKDAGDNGAINYVVDAAHFQTDGYRDHSAAQRNNFNSKLRFDFADAGKLTFIGNAVETPFVQDPLGLNSAQLAADPAQAGIGAIAYDTRKSLSQEQAGAIYDRPLGAADDLSATLYTGHRATTQYQAIPASTEASPTDPGGVIDLARNFWGIDAHVVDHRDLLGKPLQLTAGLSYDDLEEARKGYVNFIGDTLGVEGELRLDEANHVYDLDEYLQLQWDPGARWRVLAGLRNSDVDVSSHDHLPVPSGDQDSGVRYGAVDPVAGITFRIAPTLNSYLAFGRGFETPTLNDLAYRSTNGSLPGLNFGLQPARSDNYEVGIKAELGWLRADLDAFYVKTEHELAVLADETGKSVYQNIGETERRGIELAADAVWTRAFSARLAYTYLHAVVVQPYTTCVGAPCSGAPCAVASGCKTVVVAAGSYLPAVPMNALYAGLTWRYAPRGISITLETQGRAQIYADDRNSEAAGGYWVENLSVGWEQQGKHWRFTEFGRLDNLANRRYVGSVIVNESNSRFFEPAPGRTALIMFTAARRSE
ncbi:MAG: TonB-dependent receptor family protein [Steroidobacteraceae bacterium]|jgi:iron complex outermembrane recepter protein